MNHLAHALLAGTDPESLVGNIAGDFVRGRLQTLPVSDGVRAGIQLHRQVDVYTDAHAVPARLRDLFRPGMRRYAGIILDVAFDHFLCVHWHRFSGQGRREFIDGVYATLTEHGTSLPEELAALLPRLIEVDWLDRCISLDGVEQTLCRIAARLRRGSPLPGPWRILNSITPRWRRAFCNSFRTWWHSRLCVLTRI
ncbi:acyl carrier protein phosphodiesterase [Kineobactrum salinum]|uniref:DUF479 domain-containing protein n=1 Tax=Kineobactrum salinum TaxID=2708301 RepID=A0A6C0U7R5_9GAMM|nr:ACP phosphodiesterase [Kineobactrum salinum]QIB67389.1 DUF479 domain-containing protein [Kineobactrum salinum]